MNDLDTGLATRIEALSPRQRLLLACRLVARPEFSNTQAMDSEDAAQQRLVAYVRGPKANEEVRQSLRGWLELRVPNYMVPQSIVILDHIPKNETGKLDRRALMALRSEGETPDCDRFVAPRNDAEKILISIWEAVLKMDSVSIYDNFFEVGGDSLLSIRILARARQQGLNISPERFFSHPTVAEQAAAAGRISKVKPESGLVKGSAPLLPIQHWFFERITVDPQYWNHSILLSLFGKIELTTLERVIQQILLHHDGLRLTFQNQNNRWKQSFAPLSAELPLETLDLSSQLAEAWVTLIDQLAARLNSDFNLDQGPLVRFALIHTAPDFPDKVLVVIHHLIVDGESWRILLEDLSSLCQQIGRGETIGLARKTSSFKTWALRLQDFATSETLATEVDWWSGKGQHTDFKLPVDFDATPNANCVGTAASVSVALDVDQTKRLLHDIPQVYRTQINDVLLTALCQVLHRWSGATSILIDVEGHGREALFDDIDLSRTVGWFTTVYPVLLSFDPELDLGRVMRNIKEQLRDIPNHGIGHGILSYLSSNAQLRKTQDDIPRAELCFNYLGRVERQYDFFQIERMQCGPARSPRGPRAYLLDINAQIVNDCLCIDWTYSDAIHKHQSILDLARWYIESLTELISLSQSLEAEGFTPSDFPLANLDQGQLDGLTQLLDQIDD